jgi:predicted glycogen debranching enzyme
MIAFDKDICGDLGAASSREWLETNGLGGFAASTIIGLNTRRYHALLTASLRPPVERYVLLSKFEEALLLDGRRFELSANQYPGVFHPQGYQYLERFRLDPFPVFTYEVEGVEIEKSVFMVHGENTTVVQYEVKTPQGKRPTKLLLELRPLIAFRDYHSATHENGSLRREVRVENGRAVVAPYDGLPALYFAHDAEQLDPSGDWYRNFEYAAERERGLDYVEDLYSPFVLRFDLSKRRQAAVIASIEARDAARASDYREAEIERRAALLARLPSDQPLVRDLVAAADQYIVARGEQKTIIAGYPWFSDWGRDTMIALPGLALVTGRYDVARGILLAFARHVDRGMLPNRFPDAGEQPEYNTVDATLWFFEAVRSYLQYTGDLEFVRAHLYDALGDIVSWHVRGTRYGIKVDASGLLSAGEPGVQLTWMDAKIGDWVVTPRYGKPVEIQALWHNALCVMEDLAGKFGDPDGQRRYSTMATLARWSFNRLFWNESAGCLYDVVNGGPPDASIRPNQIFAVSLHHSLLPEDRARRVVEVVQRDLLTPYGLRSLARGDGRYRPHYGGDPFSRDSAYHQGTVWPWLLGPFLGAYLKVHGRTPEAQQQAEAWLEPLRQHLSQAGLGHVSEVFDAEPPYTPGGCFAQAWSVAELLRAAVEDVYAARPQAKTGKLPTSARPRKDSASSATL